MATRAFSRQGLGDLETWRLGGGGLEELGGQRNLSKGEAAIFGATLNIPLSSSPPQKIFSGPLGVD